ncbi:MAG: hypothetical protein EOP45_14940 [Sphingobacteriaceae bacterium]|nr:MAG: hypothetical protein EOP45_14940 [Sphingobacteriaceae bacterium]
MFINTLSNILVQIPSGWSAENITPTKLSFGHSSQKAAEFQIWSNEVVAACVQTNDGNLLFYSINNIVPNFGH